MENRNGKPAVKGEQTDGLILLHTALAVEARPFLAHWRMRRQWSSRLGSYAEAPDGAYGLVVSGTGAPAAAAAVAGTLTRLEGAGRSVRGLFSVGFAGCPWTDLPLGAARLIHQIRDVFSGRTYYPDVLYRHDWIEASLETHGRMVTAATDRPQALVDMEAAGVFVAARAFLPTHAMGFLKVVSDHLEGVPLDPKTAESWIAAQVPAIEAFLRKCFHSPSRLPQVPVTLREATKSWADAFRLTATQRIQLHDAVRAAFLLGRKDWSLFAERPSEALPKTARNRKLEAICDELAATL